MKLRAVTSLMLLTWAGALRAADPQMVNLAMPDAQFLAGAYPDRIPAVFQQFLLAMFPPQSSAAISSLLTAPGLDATHDIHELLFATTDPTHQFGLVLARGSFDVAGITSGLTAQGQIQSDYNGVTVLTTADNTVSLAFPDSSLAILGAPATVTAAIDRITTPSQPDPTLAALADQLSASQDVWAASIFRPTAPDAPATLYDLVRGVTAKVKQSTAGAKLGGALQSTAQFTTDTEEDAAAVAGIVRLMTAMAKRLQPPSPAALVGAFAQKITVSVKGNTVSLSLAVPVDQLPAAPSASGKKSASRTPATQSRRQ